MKPRRFRAKLCTRKELAEYYGCCAKTISQWIKDMGDEFGPRNKKLLSPAQVRLFVKRYGKP